MTILRTTLQIHFIAFIIFHITSQIVCLDPGDDGRPYEFGFTIDGEQHRHESRDVKGIVQGEFGFITGDGVYHVTVYATDENGNFHILSTKNIKVSEPLDQLEGKSKTKNIQLPEIHQVKGKDVEVISVSNRNAAAKLIEHPGNRQQNKAEEHHQNRQDVASHTREDLTTTTAKSTFVFTTKPTLRPGCGGCGIPHPSTAKPGRMEFQTPEFKNSLKTGDVSTRNEANSQQNLNLPQTNGDGNKPFTHGNGENFAENHGLQGNDDFTQRNKNTYQQNGDSINSNGQFGGNNAEDFTTTHSDGFNNARVTHGGTSKQNNEQFSEKNNGFLGGNNNFGRGNDNGFPSVGGIRGSNEHLEEFDESLPDKKFQVDGTIDGNFGGENGFHKENSYNPNQNHDNQGDVEFVNKFDSSYPNNPSEKFANLKQVVVDDGQIRVPNNPTIPIKDKYPNMEQGLPNGIEEKDILDLLYRFNYTFNFHGHYEKGYKDGTKIGGYFVNGRDGISRVVTYIADDKGYRPKFKLVNLGLDSEETPKEATEKTFKLKSFEFVWYPIS